MKSKFIWAGVLAAAATLVFAETKADQTESLTVNGKTIAIKYSSPAVNGRVGKTLRQGWHHRQRHRLSGVARRRQCRHRFAH